MHPRRLALMWVGDEFISMHADDDVLFFLMIFMQVGSCAWVSHYVQPLKREHNSSFVKLPVCVVWRKSIIFLSFNLYVSLIALFPLPPTLQMIPPLLALSQNRSKLKLYIAHLTDLCHDRDPSILSQLTPPSHYHHSDPEDWEEELQKMSVEQVVEELSVALSYSSRHL